MNQIKYVLMDPSKNITILVETKIPIDKQNEVAKKLMDLEPKAEQLGFIMSSRENEIIIRMAGGEFCGNAAMSVASLYAIENEFENHNIDVAFYGNENNIRSKVKVSVKRMNEGTYEALVHMPVPKNIETINLTGFKELPIVSLDGISHIIVDEEVKKNLAEKYIKNWCNDLNLEALGLMFYKKINDTNYELRPLVYVRDIGSLFWENACASGTYAFGIYMMSQDKKLSHIYIRQAGGDVMEVKNEDDNFCLIGQVKYLCERIVNI